MVVIPTGKPSMVRAMCSLAPLTTSRAVTGNQRSVGLRKADPAEVLRQGMLLRTTVGTIG